MEGALEISETKPYFTNEETEAGRWLRKNVSSGLRDSKSKALF